LKKPTFSRVLLYVVALLVATIFLFPYYLLSIISLKSEILTLETIFSFTGITLSNYANVILNTDFPIWFGNSMLVAIGSVIPYLIFCSMAGYVFAKREFPGKRPLFAIIIFTLTFSISTIIIPLYLELKALGWTNSYFGLIIPATAGAFGIFFMRQFIETFPDELIDAARIDGYSEFRIFWSIVLPNCKPAIGALSVFKFLTSWNEFFYVLIMVYSNEMFTLPLGIANLQMYLGQFVTNYGEVMTASALATLPVIILFAFTQKYVWRAYGLAGFGGK